jgi:alpha-glucosidase
MQWDDSGHAGFSQAEPWLPLGQHFQHMNVAHERADPTSIYNLHRKLIGLRRSRPALTSGSYRGLASGESSGDLLLFLREAQNERLLVALNFGAAPAVASFANAGFTGDLLLSSYLDCEGGSVRDMIRMRPNEGVVIRISVGNHSDLLRFEHQTRAERNTQ